MKKLILLLIMKIVLAQMPVLGQLKITAGANVKTINGAHLVVNNLNLVNNGTIQQATNSGYFDFRGSVNDSISGTGITVFDRVNLSKDPGSLLVLQRNIAVNAEFIFNGGILYLDNYVLDLDGLGVLTSETENNRAFTYGTGYIQANRLLNGPSSVNIGKLGAVISSTKNLGNTIIRRGHQAQSNIYNTNNSILRYYDIIPTNNISLKATLRFQYFDAELNGISEATVTQWKKSDPVLWDYVGHDSKDASANYVLRNNISKFSRWTLAFDTATVIVRSAVTSPLEEITLDHFTVKIAPNPSSQAFSIMVQSSDQKENIMLRVMDAGGRLIEQKTAVANQFLKLGDNYRPGTYLIQVIQGKQTRTFKVIKL